MATQVAFSDLDSWLQAQPDNTADTPYELEITGLTASDIGDSSTSGTLGYVISHNRTKYVDLRETNLPSNITSFVSCFYGCNCLVFAPVIPNGVTNIDSAFYGCVSLVASPVIPNGVAYIRNTFFNCRSLTITPIIPDSAVRVSNAFKGCTSLLYKSIIPSSITGEDRTTCYSGVSATEWRGTKNQVTTYLTNTHNQYAYEVEAETPNEIICTGVYISQLSTWLSNQENNTVDTPYKVDVVGLDYGDFSNSSSTLPTALKANPTKYVDLSFTALKEGIVEMNSTFSGCLSLIYSPVLATTLTSIYGVFSGCVNLKEAPSIPPNCESLAYAFYDCETMEKPPFLNNNSNISHCFEKCYGLQYKPIAISPRQDTDAYKDVVATRFGGTRSQVETWLPTQTSNPETYVVDETTKSILANGVRIEYLSQWLENQDVNTTTTPYVVLIVGLTTSNASDIKTALIANNTKYVDLEYTTIPSGTDCTLLFGGLNKEDASCTTLVKSSALPSGATSLNATFSGCVNLQEAPSIPSSVTYMESTFQFCTALTEPAVLPNGLQSAIFLYKESGITSTGNLNLSSLTACVGTFYDCKQLVTVQNLPPNLTNMMTMFYGCTALESLGSVTIPSTVTNMYGAFSNSGLVIAPAIPEGVTNITQAFESCTSLVRVPSIPSTVTSGQCAFRFCSNLKTIDVFKIPFATLKGYNFRDMFLNCSSLTQIGFKVDTSTDWHVFSLSFGSSSIEGKVYGVNSNKQITTATIPSTSITKSSIRLPVLTDELWFPSGLQASEIEDVIEDMLAYKYGVFNKQVIPPNDKQMVIWADEDENHNAKVVTNIASGIEVETISASKTITPTKDKRVIVDTASITVTLAFGVTNGITTEVFAMQACTVTYYTAQGTTASLSMASGSKAVFIYYSGWKLHSNYGTTNSVAVDNMQSVSSNAVANAINNLVKYKDLSIQAQANTYIVSSGGLLYKNYISIASEIGAGHTVIGLYLRDWGGVYNYPFGIYQGDNGMVGLWTTNQAFRGNIGFRLVYI